MEQFITIYFDSPASGLKYRNNPNQLSKLNPPKWESNRYLAFNVDADNLNLIFNNNKIQHQLLDSHAELLQPSKIEFDIITHILTTNEFQIDYFTTANLVNPDTEQQYLGDEIKPHDGLFNTCQTFEDATGEPIKLIVFRNINNHHAKIIVHQNGLIEYNHINSSQMKTYWHQFMNKIMYNFNQA